MGVGVDDHHCARLVDRDIDDLGARRLDDDHLLAFFLLVGDDHLFVGDEVAGGRGPSPKALDRVHHVLLSVCDCLAQLPGPIEVFVQQIDDFWVVEQGKHALVPGLIGLERLVPLVLLEEAGRLHDLKWIRRCG
jgi:hypothetical protein